MNNLFKTLLALLLAVVLALGLCACAQQKPTADDTTLDAVSDTTNTADTTDTAVTTGDPTKPTAAPTQGAVADKTDTADTTDAAVTTDIPAKTTAAPTEDTTDVADLQEFTGLYFFSYDAMTSLPCYYNLLITANGSYYYLRQKDDDRSLSGLPIFEGNPSGKVITVRGRITDGENRRLRVYSFEVRHDKTIPIESSVKETVLALYKNSHLSFPQEILEQAGVEFPPEDSGEYVKVENYPAIAQIIDTVSGGRNTVFSPMSFNFVLRMLADGRPSDAATDALETYFGAQKNEWRRFYNKYIRELPEDFRMASAFLLREGLEFDEIFRGDTVARFNALCENMEFKKGLADYVNRWAGDNTEGMITEMLRESDVATIGNSDALALNSLYFSGKWENGFDPKNTIKGTFTLAGGTKVTADFMRSTEGYLVQNAEASGFMKYYEGGRFAFVGILPKKDKRLNKDFKLSELDIKGLLESRSDEDVPIEIPRFDISGTCDLTALLDTVGLAPLKEAGAFQGITLDGSLNVLSAMQSAHVRIDEEGAEAAAVTGFFLTKSDEQIYLQFNRPFAFLIYDTETDSVLFAGKVMDPTK